MPDREKVIKDLHDIAGFIAGRVGIEQARNFLRTIDDALALLKEQQHDLRVMFNRCESLTVKSVCDMCVLREKCRNRGASHE